MYTGPEAKIPKFPPFETIADQIKMIPPVTCACSNSSECETDHEECRCSGYSRFRSGDYNPFNRLGLFPARLKDSKGFEHCRYCGKYNNWPGYLIVCPDCGRKFPGPRPYFPFDYECGRCEES